MVGIYEPASALVNRRPRGCLPLGLPLWSRRVRVSPTDGAPVRHHHHGVKRVIPWIVTAALFAIIFRRIPIAKVVEALHGVRLAPYLAIMLPYSVAYLLVDTFALTQVLNWFNTRIAYRDVLPIRATTYLLTLINSPLGQSGIAVYLKRRDGIPFLEVASSVLFMMFVELYQLVVFSSIGYALAPRPIDLPLVPVYGVLYGYLIVHLLVFRFGGTWIEKLPFAGMLRSFRLAQPRHYLLLLLYKSPNFVMATVVYYFALQCFGIHLPYRDLVLYLPIIFLSAALPIGVAHLGVPQLLWPTFFGDQADPAVLVAFSLAAHFTFMVTNAALGIPFLPRASRDLA
jgi:hypothetical protein